MDGTGKYSPNIGYKPLFSIKMAKSCRYGQLEVEDKYKGVSPYHDGLVTVGWNILTFNVRLMLYQREFYKKHGLKYYTSLIKTVGL